MANLPKKSNVAATEKGLAGNVKPTIAKLRGEFKTLLLANPTGPFEIQSDTTYENIGCVGYNPQVKRLEAVVYINQESGYGGDICSAGSQEFVRFYLSYDNGATWQDQGMTTFTVFDVPGTKPLEYDATLSINPAESFCGIENLPKVRAILSWSVPPPPNQPNWPPTWGNVVEAQIQIAGFQLILLKDLFAELKVSIPESIVNAVDLSQTVHAATPQALSVTELSALYKEGKVVPQHRFLLPHFTQALSATPVLPPKIASLVAPPPPPKATKGASAKSAFLGLETSAVSAIVAALGETSGDTTYEQLDCIGLNPNTSQLAGVIHLKLASGYSGGPCTAGSQEYVAFWVDWGSGWEYVNTTSVTVHDYHNITAAGLRYSVFLPLDMSAHSQECDAGPKTAKVRAVLSWNVPPSTVDPFAPVTWGNSLETVTLVTPGPPVQKGMQVPFLSRVGDIDESKIGGNGRITDAFAMTTGAHFIDAPFGGVVTLGGFISNATAGMKYRIMKKPHGAPDSSYAPISNEPGGLSLTIDQFIGGVWTQTQVSEHDLGDGYYPYENLPLDNQFVEGNIMGRWYTTSAESGHAYDLRIDLSTDGNPAHDVHSNVVTVLVDNDTPDAELSLDLGGECGKFKPGDPASGHFTATDADFGGFSFVILPSGPAHGVLPAPSSGTSSVLGGAIADPGLSNQIFNLNTTGMDPCGYSLTINVWDRTNVNSGQTHNWNSASVGFCLELPVK